MADINDSSILSDFDSDIKLFAILCTFDAIDDRVTKELFIKAFKRSESHRELGYFLESRYMEPPERLPDSNILAVDVISMNKTQLQQWVEDVRLLIALKYNTYL